jgi:acetyltransferase-like isoleucine patch superfamily enzyme
MSLRLHLFNLVGALLPNRGGFFTRRMLLRWAGVRVGAQVRIATGVRVYFQNLEIGEETWIGMDTRLMSTLNGRLQIGARVDIAPMCLIGTGTHELGGPARRAGMGCGRDVVVGDGTWVGMGARLLPGAHIGTGCVVAAGAVVVAGSYPANTLLAGVPARVVRSLPVASG